MQYYVYFDHFFYNLYEGSRKKYYYFSTLQLDEGTDVMKANRVRVLSSE